MDSTTIIQQGLVHDEPALWRRFRFRLDAVQAGYAIAALAVFFGWLLTRNRELVDPLNGVGYWLGIIGASLMAILLLYPVRKRVRLFRKLGETRYWFRMHMILGVAGPIFILYHCNFRLGSLNSTIALLCTLLVAGSGLIGRYLHRHIYSKVDGHRLKLKELIDEARVGKEERSRISTFVPDLLEKMSAYDGEVLAPPDSLFDSLTLPLRLAITTRIAAIRLSLYARSQIRARAKQSSVIAAERGRIQKNTTRFVFRHLRRVRRVAELQSYERLFALWHVFHLPFFYLLVITALVHVLAVHMY